MNRAEHDRLLYLRGLACFNARAFFESHDLLEDLWLRNRSALRPYFQGLIQLAAAFHHVTHGRYAGAVGLFRAAAERLAPFSPSTLGLEVAPLLLAIAACRRHAEDLGPERLRAFDPALMPRLVYRAPTPEEFAPHVGTALEPLRGHTWLWEREGGEHGRSADGFGGAIEGGGP